MIQVFEEDWAATEKYSPTESDEELKPIAKVAKKVAKAIARELPPVAPLLDAIVREMERKPKWICRRNRWRKP